MKSLPLSRLAVVSLLILALAASACSSDASVENTPDVDFASRFQTLWTAHQSFAAENVGNPIDSTDAAEANATAGLDEGDTYLHYVDLGPRPDGGEWCMESEDDTYLAFTYGSGESTILMGDGSCSYEVDQAEVVGDFMKAEWTQGKELMGDLQAAPG